MTSRKQRTPSTRSTTAGTLSNGVSPVFSAKTSVQPTPNTSDNDEDVSKALVPEKRTTRASSGLANKRRAESDIDLDSGANEDVSALPKKRRAVARSAFIEIPVVQNPKTKVMIA
jgi:DNA repair protein RAD16